MHYYVLITKLISYRVLYAGYRSIKFQLEDVSMRSGPFSNYGRQLSSSSLIQNIRTSAFPKRSLRSLCYLSVAKSVIRSPVCVHVSLRD